MNSSDHPWKKAMHPNSLANLRPAPQNLRPNGEVSVEAIRQAFERSGLSKCELARRLGWYKTVPNIHRVNEVLGLERCSNGQKRKRVTYQTAVRLCKILNASPVEIGI